MWKIAVGFVLFAALSIFVIMKGGDKLSLAGESAGHSEEAPAAAAPGTAPAAVTPAPAK